MTSSLGLADVRAALIETVASPAEEVDGRAAAVAAVLHEGRAGVELLFIRRARRRGDPWSGHMAWPGGKREPNDGAMIECAIRETCEEVGLDLAADGELLGRLSVVRFQGTGAKGLRAIVPYVFCVARLPDLRPSAEVQETVWIPLTYFTGWATRRPWVWAARWLPQVPPAYRYEGRLVWGLTQWMLADLIARLAAGRKSLPE
ncbi:MAG TPA: CoA pyrophosphatase [Vicinamibacterales bacterium]|jgi:8-oxo-dGTP pyrophosphatase MutT (NUDIX family)